MIALLQSNMRSFCWIKPATPTGRHGPIVRNIQQVHVTMLTKQTDDFQQMDSLLISARQSSEKFCPYSQSSYIGCSKRMMSSTTTRSLEPAKSEDISDVSSTFCQESCNNGKPSIELYCKTKTEKQLDACGQNTRAKVDFSIEAILSRTTSSNTINVTASKLYQPLPSGCYGTNPKDVQFSWVYCTRYRPPKLPRMEFHYTILSLQIVQKPTLETSINVLLLN